MKWINFGGGHHITRPDYDVDRLCRLVSDFKSKYGKVVYLEPGEAVALNAGYLVDPCSTLFTMKWISRFLTHPPPPTCRMCWKCLTDRISSAQGSPVKNLIPYRLAGLSCLAGDIIGDYSFDRPLAPGDKLVFCDMAHYSMVKTNTFNGIQLPSIAIYQPETDNFSIIREFGYGDFKGRLS